jgi:hypothetical protein
MAVDTTRKSRRPHGTGWTIRTVNEMETCSLLKTPNAYTHLSCGFFGDLPPIVHADSGRFV